MKRIPLLLASAVAAMVLVSGVALSSPSESPDNTAMVNGTVRAVAQVGNNVWVGGNFSQVQRRDGTIVADVSNLAVFDSETGQYEAKAPRLGGTGSQVYDIEVYGDDVVVGGSFGGPSSTQKNLVVLDGATGEVLQWYNSPALQSVLAAPALGRIYGGGVGLAAFGVPSIATQTMDPLWRDRSKTTVDTSLRTAHPIAAGYRDLELDGSTIWAACGCDAIDGRPAKALAKLTTDGAYDSSWTPEQTGTKAFGISLVAANGALYLGAGGNDFLAKYPKSGGNPDWWLDTSGSVQAVEEMDGGLVVGGHFLEVADNPGDRCGFRSSDPTTLDPYGECRRRDGLAAYSFDGWLDSVSPPTDRVWGTKQEEGWNPVISGMHDLVWALQPDKLDPERLHFGGAFTKVDGINQTFYARLSEPGLAEASAPVVQAPVHDLTPAGSTLGTSTIPAKISWSATDQDGVSSYEVQQSTNGGPYKNVSLTSPTSPTKTLQLSPGGSYRFRVRATDGVGNVSAWAEGSRFTVDVHQESDGSTIYAGAWADEALGTAFGGSTRHARESGATATLNSSPGTDVSWAAERGPDRGKAEVRLDGVLVGTVDLYATSAQPRRVLYNATLDSPGPHTLEVKVLGTKKSASTDTRVDVDAFVILRPSS